MNRTLWLIFIALPGTSLLHKTAGAQDSPMRAHSNTGWEAVAGREGVNSVTRMARLSNDRVLYQLSHNAIEGPGIAFSLDKGNEASRRPYQPYRPAPTVAESGFVPLGLGPGGSWNRQGFFNLYINGIGLNYVSPEMTVQPGPAQSLARFVWGNSQATITQTFVLRAGDDKLLMKLNIQPLPGVKMEQLTLQLRNDWPRGNSAYNNPTHLSGAVTVASGEYHPPKRVPLQTADGPWIAYHNKELGLGISALLSLPEQTRERHVLLGPDQTVTTLDLNPQGQDFTFALWEAPKRGDKEFLSYLKTASPGLTAELAKLARTNWNSALPPVAEDAPLHLTQDTYTPTHTEQERGFVAFPGHPLRYVDTNTLPGQGLTEVTLQATPGQAEQASFSLYGLRDVGNVTVECGGLTGPGNATIPAGNLDLRIVKVWPQQTSVYGGANGEFVMTPELLVRNDTLPLSEAWTGPGTYAPDKPGRTGYITGPTLTSLPRDTTRQVWLLVNVPQGAPPGTYRGVLKVKATRGGEATLNLKVEVLPFQLKPLGDRYTASFYYRGRPRADEEAIPRLSHSDSVSLKTFKAQLQDIRDHGFNAVWLMSPSVEKFKNIMLPVYRELGFTGPVGISGWGYAYSAKFDAATDEGHRKRVGEYLALFEGQKPPMFYGIDEPKGKQVELNKRRAALTREVEVKGVRGMYSSAGDGNVMSAQVGHLDYPVVSTYFSPRELMKTLRDKFKAAGAHPLYYWQIWGEYPQGSRLNAGYFLYASGYDGIMPYAYQHFASDPYQEDQERQNEKSSYLKNMMVTYPSNEGQITTLQWEAARAGILDLRYVLTLEDAIQKAKGRVPEAQITAARSALDELLKKYGYEESRHWGRMIYGALNWPVHQTGVEPEQFDQDRQLITEWILKLG